MRGYNENSDPNILQDEEADQAENENEGAPQEATDEQRREEITQMGSVTLDGRHPIHCLTIIGQIEGHYILSPQNKTTKYEHVIPQLVAFNQDSRIEGLLIILNTVGGDVEAGLALAELIAGLKKPTVSLVLGGGHSIGVPLAVSAQKSFIVPSATMTIHPVRTNGTVLGVPQTLYYFEKMQDRIVNFVIGNSNIEEERFRSLLMKTGELVLDVGSTLNGEDAVSEGLIDHLGSIGDAIECLYDLIDEKHAKEDAEKEKEAPAKRPRRKKEAVQKENGTAAQQ